jgi:hypothetical protein
MGVDLRRLHIAVAEQFLHGADVITVLQQMGSEAVPEGVQGDGLGQAGTARGGVDGLLNRGLVQVMAGGRAEARRSCATDGSHHAMRAREGPRGR